MTILDEVELTIDGMEFNASSREMSVNQSSLLFNAQSHPRASNYDQLYVLLESDELILPSDSLYEKTVSLLLPLHSTTYYESPFEETHDTAELEDGCVFCKRENVEGRTVFALTEPPDTEGTTELKFTNVTLVGVCEDCMPTLEKAYRETLRKSPKAVSHTI